MAGRHFTRSLLVCFLFLSLLPSVSSAIDIFSVSDDVVVAISLRQPKYIKRKDGCWYDSRFPYQEKQPKYSFSVGIAGRFNKNIDWKFTYEDFGDGGMNAVGLSDDKTAGRTATSRFISEWHVRGISATVSPGISVGNTRIFIEAGVFLFRPDFRVTMPDHPTGFYEDNTPFGSQTIKAEHKAGWQLNPMFGVGVSNNKRTVSMSVHYVNLDQRERTDQYVTAYKATYVPEATINVAF